MKLLKRILYIASVILPIYDTIKGLLTGTKEGLKDLKEAKQKTLWEEINRPDNER